ncbi:MAG: type I restriction endonuclease [Verrucomicrobiales bacterium]|jgi:type I restriction enzyme, R subunit|nr:type I restriction endonuclease [Verrucomicrobiales bacterium]
MSETPEQQARETIDAQLAAAGWAVQNLDQINLSAARGVAVREMQSQGGPADYILFVDGKALGVLEAKKAGTTLSGVAEQSQRYTAARKWIPRRWADPLPFTYESTGVETNFRDQRDPDSRSRPVFAFHTPEHLLELVQQPDTLHTRLKQFPALKTAPLRDCQIDAVTSLEKSLAANRPRALIQMATGSGKTFTAVTQAYRLAPTFGLRAVAQPCGLPVSPTARLLKLADEMTELSSKVAEAPRLSSWIQDQRRDASATMPRPSSHPSCLCG